MNTEKYDDADRCRPIRIRRFENLGSVLSLEKLGQTFFAVIVTKTPLLMEFLVYELNCQHDTSGNAGIRRHLCFFKCKGLILISHLDATLNFEFRTPFC
jgi:hypothetical protein